MQIITQELAAKVLEVVDAGLVRGLGHPEPGAMCVEAAVCYAMGLRHGDEPACVSPALRNFKILLNDAFWSSTSARANGLRRLALAQLGSAGALDDQEFVKRLADTAIRRWVPTALRIAAATHKDKEHKAALLDAATRCERDGDPAATSAAAYVATSAATYTATYAADAAEAATYAAYYATATYATAATYASAASYAATAAATSTGYAADAERDKHLAAFSEDVVQILIEMNAPGCQWLSLTEQKEYLTNDSQ